MNQVAGPPSGEIEKIGITRDHDVGLRNAHVLEAAFEHVAKVCAVRRDKSDNGWGGGRLEGLELAVDA